jgi:hypothetical protein
VRERPPKNKNQVDLYTHNNREWLKKNHDREKKKTLLFCGLLLLLWAGLRDWFDPISPHPLPALIIFQVTSPPGYLLFSFLRVKLNDTKKEKGKRKRKE